MSKPVGCWMCDGEYFSFSHRPAQRAWSIFGITFRRYRPAVLLMTCRTCGAVNERRPGTVRRPEQKSPFDFGTGGFST